MTKKHFVRGMATLGLIVLPLSAAAVEYYPDGSVKSNSNSSVEMHSESSDTGTSTSNQIQDQGSATTPFFSSDDEVESDASLQLMIERSMEQHPSFYEKKLLTTFEKVGARNPSLFDNSSLQESPFDYTAYVAHRCFSIVNDFDRAWCTVEFGSLADLKTVLFSGKLSEILHRSGMIAPFDVDLIAGVAGDVQLDLRREAESRNVFGFSNSFSAQEMDDRDLTEMQSRMDRRQRSERVWSLCQERYSDEFDRSACFQRNQRVILDTSVDVEGNVY